jgi:hypothetical protein
MNNTISAFDYTMLLQQLPNPNHYIDGYRKRKETTIPVIKISYLPQSINVKPVVLGLPDQPLNTMSEIRTLEFQLVPNRNMWYWQPLYPLTIVPDEVGRYV